MITGDQNIEEVSKKRRIMNYYDKITQGKSPVTMETMDLMTNTAYFAVVPNHATTTQEWSFTNCRNRTSPAILC